MRTDARTWGQCWHAFLGAAEVDLIEIKKGGHSSVHRHSSKGNLFVLVDGAVDVLIYGDDVTDNGDPVPPFVVETRQLRKRGDSTGVGAGVFHQFVTLEDSVVAEVYLPAEPSPSDIERVTKNGLLDERALQEYLQLVY